MPVTLLLLLGSVTCDVIGQVCFKLGVGHREGGAAHGVRALLRRIAGSPWIALGVATYAVEFVLWFAALSRAPLSFAFPIAALSYVGVVLASRWILRERVSARRWLGTAAIVIGVALVCGQQLG
ncbi:MAG TPA: EamA family transporter [Rhodanobacteraceae bacterium]|jgi:drug/metabolite transporter (DMT)-like permease|nr:EamA family transporter [Rhodanobacteraceae bacterium]